MTVWTGLVTAQRIKSWLRGNVTGLFGVLSVFGRRIQGMIRLQPEQVCTCNVTLHVQNFSGRNRVIPLMRRPNTDSTPNKPATLRRNQLLICYAVTSPVHTVTIRCYDKRWRHKCGPTLNRVSDWVASRPWRPQYESARPCAPPKLTER